MTPNPILKVLFTLRKCNVKSLLIGGQACIIYGAAEFSRDSDFVVLSQHENLECLKKALKTLKAEPIYFPELKADYLERGHACHFRCNAKDVKGLRVDVLAKLRGCEPFDRLWERRKTVSFKKEGSIEVIGLHDLVRSKKTQRDKDWLMLKRLVENDIILNEGNPGDGQVKWWLLESRNPETIVRLVKKYPETAMECISKRPLLSKAAGGDMQRLVTELQEEEQIERQKDINYWAPLKKELEILRHSLKEDGKS